MSEQIADRRYKQQNNHHNQNSEGDGPYIIEVDIVNNIENPRIFNTGITPGNSIHHESEVRKEKSEEMIKIQKHRVLIIHERKNFKSNCDNDSDDCDHHLLSGMIVLCGLINFFHVLFSGDDLLIFFDEQLLLLIELVAVCIRNFGGFYHVGTHGVVSQVIVNIVADCLNLHPGHVNSDLGQHESQEKELEILHAVAKEFNG